VKIQTAYYQGSPPFNRTTLWPTSAKLKIILTDLISNQLKKKDCISNEIHKEAIMYVHKASYAKLCKNRETMYALLFKGFQHKLGR
jgi:hypothetical protein